MITIRAGRRPWWRFWTPRPVLMRVNARTLDSLEFTLKDGSEVLYGLAVDQPAKDAAVLLVRRTLKREGREAQRIDVRNPSAPTVKATPGE